MGNWYWVGWDFLKGQRQRKGMQVKDFYFDFNVSFSKEQKIGTYNFLT